MKRANPKLTPRKRIYTVYHAKIETIEIVPENLCWEITLLLERFFLYN